MSKSAVIAMGFTKNLIRQLRLSINYVPKVLAQNIFEVLIG